MQTLYFELNEDTAARLDLPRYVFHNYTHPKYYYLMFQADRVWLEDEQRVVFAKNRFEDRTTAVVDMKEFMLVKLRSVGV